MMIRAGKDGKVGIIDLETKQERRVSAVDAREIMLAQAKEQTARYVLSDTIEAKVAARQAKARAEAIDEAAAPAKPPPKPKQAKPEAAPEQAEADDEI